MTQSTLRTFPEVKRNNSSSLKKRDCFKKMRSHLMLSMGLNGAVSHSSWGRFISSWIQPPSCLFLWATKPCQAITGFIDAWAILSFGTDVASQETIIQRAILNTWITPQLHTLLTWFHVVILKCKDGPWEKNTEPGRNLNGEMPKLPRRKRSLLLWERRLNEKPVFHWILFFSTYRIRLSKLSPMKEFLSTVWMCILSWTSLEESTDGLDV